MNLIDQHIRKHLFYFQNKNDAFFQEIVELIQTQEKSSYVLLLRYVHLLLNEAFSDEQEEPRILHLHFTSNLDDDSLKVVAQYLLIRFFIESHASAASLTDGRETLKPYKVELNCKLTRLKTAPEGARGKNGGNKIYKNWNKEKNDLRALIDFYEKLDNDISTNTIFNCQVRLANSLKGLLATNPYACTIEDYKTYLTSNLLNTNLTLNEIDETDNSIVDNLETVVLFDCERKRQMQNFSLKDITDSDINLKRYLIFSFGNKHNSIQSLRDKLTLIQKRFKISDNESYPILQSELEFCLKQKVKKYIPVSFVGIDSSNLWDAFILETNIHDLYELRSIKMMNLYSLCLSEEIKIVILNDLFSKNNTSEIVSDETKQRLLDLSDEDVSILRDCLGNVLDLIIRSDLKQILSAKISYDTILLVDDLVIKTKRIKQLLFSALQVSSNSKLSSWSDFKNIEGANTLILSYQDQGKYPYHFYPNVIEATVLKNSTTEAVYHRFLFSTRYQWAKYNIAKDLYNLTSHPTRQKHFQRKRLKDSINGLRPQKRDDTNWDLEQQYSGNINRETVRIKLKDEREKTFNSSDLFIFSMDDKQTFKVDKIGIIIESIDENEKCFLYNLDEIQERINLYEKMTDTTQQEEELNIIRQQFQLNDSETGRLWKLLLKKKASNSNEETLYDELKTHLESKGLKIVSLFHFKNNWLNPESESIAPISKRVFIELCNFLNLPKTYFILIQRLRNSSKQASRQSTRQMNRLLQDLFNDGSFDNGVDINKVIETKLEEYKRKHPLDELGIDEKYLGDNLIALVKLIKEEVTLKELDKFKRIE